MVKAKHSYIYCKKGPINIDKTETIIKKNSNNNKCLFNNRKTQNFNTNLNLLKKFKSVLRRDLFFFE